MCEISKHHFWNNYIQRKKIWPTNSVTMDLSCCGKCLLTPTLKQYQTLKNTYCIYSNMRPLTLTHNSHWYRTLTDTMQAHHTTQTYYHKQTSIFLASIQDTSHILSEFALLTTYLHNLSFMSLWLEIQLHCFCYVTTSSLHIPYVYMTWSTLDWDTHLRTEYLVPHEQKLPRLNATLITSTAYASYLMI